MSIGADNPMWTMTFGKELPQLRIFIRNPNSSDEPQILESLYLITILTRYAISPFMNNSRLQRTPYFEM